MPIRQERISLAASAPLLTAFQRSVSALRWGTYLEAAGFNDDRALALYIWNAAIGQSFHFPLQAAEVALRNVVHYALTAEFGADWPCDPASRVTLGSGRSDDIEKVVRRIRQKYKMTPHSDQIVASLTLGFWTALLKRQYNRPIWDRQTPAAFPHLEPHQTIRDVSAAANTIQDLRNRIFHHEPLIGRDLSADYAAILKLTGWICCETREWVRTHCSVPIVLRMRPRA